MVCGLKKKCGEKERDVLCVKRMGVEEKILQLYVPVLIVINNIYMICTATREVLSFWLLAFGTYQLF
tara:strand:- start:540 stop:740 length:201 start_codon:yes stop_codon:yes gene_type:complete